MATLISEFQPDSESNTATFELSGTPGDSFDGVIIRIESDASDAGIVDRFASISGTFDPNGLLTSLITWNFEDTGLDDPSYTFVLLDSYSGDTNTDLDGDDDGENSDESETFLGNVLDAIGIPDTNNNDEILYGAQLGGTDFAFTGDDPRLIFRDASVGDLYAINDPDNGQVFDTNGNDVTTTIFDSDPTTGTDTFNAINPSTALDSNLEISEANAVWLEGDTGTTAFTFTVTRSGDTSTAHSVDFVVSGAEVNATDLGGTLPSGTVNFAANEITQTITLNVAGDTLVEPDEDFIVTLVNPTNGAIITTGNANGTIQNDDNTTLAIANANAVQLEGDTGTTDFTFTVTRSGDTSTAHSVDFVVSGAEVNAADFGGTLPSGTVNFAANEITQTITLNVAGDTLVEPDEDFIVTLANPTNGAIITTGNANGTIQNDDNTTLAIANANAVQLEGDAGTTDFTFTVTRSGDTIYSNLCRLFFI